MAVASKFVCAHGTEYVPVGYFIVYWRAVEGRRTLANCCNMGINVYEDRDFGLGKFLPFEVDR